MFKRVLMVWLKDEARADAPALESAYRALPGKVNGLLSVTAGPPAEGEYDLVIEMRFRDSMAMRLCEASADYKALYARLEAAAARLEASAFGEDDRGDGVLESQRAEAYPMKWHKFLIYFALWAGAVLNLISGVQMFSVGLNAGGMLWIGYEMSSGLPGAVYRQRRAPDRHRRVSDLYAQRSGALLAPGAAHGGMALRLAGDFERSGNLAGLASLWRAAQLPVDR